MNINVYLFIILYAFKLPKRGVNNELPTKRNILKLKKIITNKNKNNGYNFAKNETNMNHNFGEIIYKKMLLDKLVDVNINDLEKIEFIKKEDSITGNNLEKGGLFKDWEMGNDF
jgi:hypothetical protein